MYRIFRHYIPKSLLILGVAEALILLVSVYLGVTIRLFHVGEGSGAHGLAAAGDLLPKALLFALVMVAVMTAMGLYQRDLRDGARSILIRISISFCVGLMLMAFIYAVFPGFFVGRGPFAIALFSAFVGIVSCRFLCYQRTDSRLQRRTLVLGCGEQAAKIEKLRRKTDHLGICIVGYADVGNGPRLVNDKKILSRDVSLLDLVEQYQVDEIVVAMDDRRNAFPVDSILECKMRGVHVIESTTFYERQLGKIRLDSLRPSNVVFSDGFSQAVLKSGGKRAFDMAVSAALLLVALPVMAVTALAIYLESGAPIIYRQKRVGRHGKVFEVLKFRSMRVDAEKDGVAQWARKNDNRVTRVGAFIRKTRLDELPQLVNVLRGDMSFVGPRPERPQFVDELSHAIPYYGLRHHVKPGITGWAQICYPYGATVADAREKLQYDLYYMKNYSLFLDLTIIVQTIQVILWGKGAR